MKKIEDEQSARATGGGRKATGVAIVHGHGGNGGNAGSEKN